MDEKKRRNNLDFGLKFPGLKILATNSFKKKWHMHQITTTCAWSMIQLCV
jgi:hypothetical protein